MDVNDNFTQSVHQAQMDRIEELEAENEALHDYAQGELERANKAEAENLGLRRFLDDAKAALVQNKAFLRITATELKQAEAENERLRIAYDVQKAATCQFVIVSAEDGPKAVDEGMTKAYQVASEQKSRANDAEAELAALRAVLIQSWYDHEYLWAKVAKESPDGTVEAWAARAEEGRKT